MAVRSRPLSALLGGALLLVAGCSCPPLEPRFTTPRETLGTWQAAFCHDDGELEYETLSRDYRDAMGGYEIYNAARTYLRSEEPVFAWLLKHGDLEGSVVEELVSPDGSRARLVLERAEQRITVEFQRETALVVELDDGTTRRALVPAPLSALMLTDGRAWAVAAQKSPRLSDEDLSRVRAVTWTSPWRIAFIDGLEPGAARGPSP